MLAGARWMSRAWSFGVIAWACQAVFADDAPSTEAPSTGASPAAKAVSAEQTVLLKYKFQPGQFVHYEVSDRVRYVTQQGGNAFESLTQNDSSKHLRVVSVDDDGSVLLEPIIDRIRMSAKLHDQPLVEFDSAKDKVAPAKFQRHKETVGKPMARFKHAPNGELLEVRIIDADIVKSGAAADKADPKVNFLIPLPKEPIAVGHRWKQKYDAPVSVGQGLTQQIPMLRQFELKGVSEGIATIKFRTSILALLNDPKIQGQLAQQTPSGTIEFDIERGLIRSRKSVTNEAVVNAFGPQSLLQVEGESTEKMIPNAPALQQVGFTKESDSTGK